MADRGASMRGVDITREAYEAVKASLPKEMIVKPTQVVAGAYRIWLPLITLKLIDAARDKGETRSATIIRLATT